MTPGQLLQALRARWLILCATWLACMLVGIALVLFRTPLYTVQASVMLDIRTVDPVGGVAIPALGVGNYIATQADLIRSVRVAQRMIREQRIDQDPLADQVWRERTGGGGDKVAWLAEAMLRNLTVTPSRESNLIGLTYTDSDPARATTTLKALLDAYVALTVELRTDAARRSNVFFEGQVGQLRDMLAAAQERLSAQQRNAGVVANDERLDVENARLIELSSQLLGLQMAAGDTGSRQRMAAGQIGDTQEALNSPLISQLTADLGRQEARLNELAVRLGEQHPELVQGRAAVASLRTRLNDEMQRLGKSLGVTNSVLISRVTELRTAYEAQRQKVALLKAQRDQTSVLQRDVENANQAYSAIVARARQADLESLAVQSNAAIVREPSLPIVPSQPRVVLTLALSAFAGLVLGLAAALARELVDRRVRVADDVTLLLGQSLVGSLPHDRTVGDKLAARHPGLLRMFHPARALGRP